MRQHRQRPVQVRRFGLLQQLFELGRLDLADGDADEDVNQRRSVGEVAAESETGPQCANGIVETTFGNRQSRLDGISGADVAIPLHLR